MKNLNAVKSTVYTTGSTCKQSAINKYKNVIEMGDDVVTVYGAIRGALLQTKRAVPEAFYENFKNSYRGVK